MAQHPLIRLRVIGTAGAAVSVITSAVGLSLGIGTPVLAAGPPAGGLTLLQLLNYLEGYDVAAMGWPSVDGALARVRRGGAGCLQAAKRPAVMRSGGIRGGPL